MPNAVNDVVLVGLHPGNREVGQRTRSVPFAKLAAEGDEILTDLVESSLLRLLANNVRQRRVIEALRAEHFTGGGLSAGVSAGESNDDHRERLGRVDERLPAAVHSQ